MNEKIYIYTLADPRTGLVKYVGKTNDPTYRLRKHLTERNTTYKCQWVKGLLALGLKPVMDVIDECPSDNWEVKERHYIRFYKAIGANLVNTLPGGEGGATMLGKKLTEDQRRKIVLSKQGKANKGAAQSNKINKGYKVNQFDLSGNLIATHQSMIDAAKSIGRSSRRIQAMVSNGLYNGKKINHVGGFKFERVAV